MESLQEFTNRIIKMNLEYGVKNIGTRQWLRFFQRDVEEKYNKKISPTLVKTIVKQELNKIITKPIDLEGQELWDYEEKHGVQ